MLIIKATTLDSKDLHVCQDSVTSLIAIKKLTALNDNYQLASLIQPIVTLMGNSARWVINFKYNFTFKFGENLFIAGYFVFEKL